MSPVAPYQRVQNLHDLVVVQVSFCLLQGTSCFVSVRLHAGLVRDFDSVHSGSITWVGMPSIRSPRDRTKARGCCDCCQPCTASLSLDGTSPYLWHRPSECLSCLHAYCMSATRPKAKLCSSIAHTVTNSCFVQFTSSEPPLVRSNTS